VFDGAVCGQEFAAVGKTVWSDVEDAHQQRAFAEDEGVGWEAETKDFSEGHWRWNSLA